MLIFDTFLMEMSIRIGSFNGKVEGIDSIFASMYGMLKLLISLGSCLMCFNLVFDNR